ncbi:MAG: cupin domain-containing protein [Mucilaginibacter sp.]
MKRLLVLLLTAVTATAGAQTATTLKSRIVFNDVTKPRTQTGVHEGAGGMEFTQLFGAGQMTTPFLYLHAGLLNAKSSIGQHFHNTIEEMYVLLSGEAEFTVNGRTAVIKAPAMVPCRMGDSHGIYNYTNQNERWLNFGVSFAKGNNDAFNLGDDRVGVVVDKTPSFIFGRLDPTKLRGAGATYPGTGVKYRRIMGPEVFKTQWDHVDDVVLPAGVNSGEHTAPDQEEVFYVVKGKGTISNGTETADLVQDDAFHSQIGEKLTFVNNGTDDLELLVIGVSNTPKSIAALANRGGFGRGPGGPRGPGQGAPGQGGPGALRGPGPGMGVGIGGANAETPATPKAMALQMDFVVPADKAEAFEKMYSEIYVPAMKKQQGYVESRLLRLYPVDVEKSIEGEATTYNYQIQISFATEADRKKWTQSKEHPIAWGAATKLGATYKWRGYDVLGADNNK